MNYPILLDVFTHTNTHIHQEALYYFLSRDWAGSKWPPVHKV